MRFGPSDLSEDRWGEGPVWAQRGLLGRLVVGEGRCWPGLGDRRRG